MARTRRNCLVKPQYPNRLSLIDDSNTIKKLNTIARNQFNKQKEEQINANITHDEQQQVHGDGCSKQTRQTERTNKRIIIGEFCEQIEYENDIISSIKTSKTSISASNYRPNSVRKYRKRKRHNVGTPVKADNENINNISILEQIFSPSTENSTSVNSAIKKVKSLSSPSPSKCNNISILEQLIATTPKYSKNPCDSITKKSIQSRSLRNQRLLKKRNRSNNNTADEKIKANHIYKNSNSNDKVTSYPNNKNHAKLKENEKERFLLNASDSNVDSNNNVNSHAQKINKFDEINHNDNHSINIEEEEIRFSSPSKLIYDVEIIQPLQTSIIDTSPTAKVFKIDSKPTITNERHKNESYINSLTNVFFAEKVHDDDDDDVNLFYTPSNDNFRGFRLYFKTMMDEVKKSQNCSFKDMVCIHFLWL